MTTNGERATREVPAEVLTALDSHVSWCRHRHRNQPETGREMDRPRYPLGDLQ